MTLGERLNNEREKRGLSQRYVATQLGISNTVLSNYERDYREPDTRTLIALSKFYSVSVDYLLTGLYGGNTVFSATETKIIGELRKHPDLSKDLEVDVEKEISDIARWQQFKKTIKG